ncbi:MAG: hypothetical protein AAGU75_21395 [Bacillota bacterium]|jgi:hypothetical protein
MTELGLDCHHLVGANTSPKEPLQAAGAILGAINAWDDRADHRYEGK